MLAGPQSVSTAVDRVRGYRRAFQDAELAAQEEQIVWGSYTQDAGYDMAQQVLSATSRPTALFAANNFIAIGALQALRENGLRVPEDMALVTMDDIPPTFVIEPFLTVATQPAREMGQQAARLLLERVKGEIDSPCQQIVLPSEIIIRASSGKMITA